MSRRSNPLRTRWPGLGEIDARITELALKQHELHQTIQELGEQRIVASQRDEARLADWFAVGAKGDDRPPLEVTRLEEEVASAQADLAALEHLTERACAERVAFVAKHRRRLVKSAHQETEVRARPLPQAGRRDGAGPRGAHRLPTNRSLRLDLPLRHARVTPPTLALCGGLLRPGEEAILGLKNQLPAHAVLKLLRADATHLSTVSTVDQAAEMQNTPPPTAS